MKLILVFVSALDGKITKWGNPSVRDWSSLQDQQYYSEIWRDASLIVMGSNTFNADRFPPSEKHLLVVMTRQISRYSQFAVKGQVEFTDDGPQELVNRFKNTGIDTMIVAGGPHIATSFLKENLIDELWLTLEPRIFGTGGNFVTDHPLDVKLRMISCEKVNKQGTLITKYEVIKET